MDECQNVINFEQFDAINVDDATERKMVNNNFRINSFYFMIECLGQLLYKNHRILFIDFFIASRQSTTFKRVH